MIIVNERDITNLTLSNGNDKRTINKIILTNGTDSREIPLENFLSTYSIGKEENDEQ